MRTPVFLLMASFLFLGLCAHGQNEDGAQGNRRKLADSLRYQKGDISIRGGLAKIHLPSEFRYLDPTDAETVLSKVWRNPPDNQTLGMLVPADISVASPEGWAVVITYDEDGYVKDNDAAKINYDEILKKLQNDTRQSNAERVKEGYPEMDLVGWATPPRYDPSKHKMYWAKEFKVTGSPENSLNYNIRILGRRGVLVLNAVAGMTQLREIEEAAPKVIAMVDFQEGHRYVDFNASTDKVATYGLAALVAGGVLAKVGGFKALFGFLLLFKKGALIGIAAIAAFFKKLFGKKDAELR